MKSRSIDECIAHIIDCKGENTDNYLDGTKVYEFRAKKYALMLFRHVSDKKISHFVYQKGRNVYFSQNFGDDGFAFKGRQVSGWKPCVRKLAKLMQKQLSLPGI